MNKSTWRFNAEPRLAVVTVIQLIDELKLHGNLQHRHITSLITSCFPLNHTNHTGVYGWQKMTSVWFSVRFAKNCGFRFGFGFTKLTAVCGFRVWFLRCVLFNVYALYWVQFLTVSRSDSELEVQRSGMKKNTFTIDSIMLEDEQWMRRREKLFPNRRSHFFENQTAETEFSVFEFWGQFGSVQFLENWYPTFSSGSTHP